VSRQVAILVAAAVVVAAALAAEKRKAPLRIVFVQSPACQQCRRVKKVLPALQKTWSDRVEIVEHGMGTVEDLERLLEYEDHYDVRVPHPPAIFVGKRALVGADEILKQLESAVAVAIRDGHQTFVPGKPSPDSQPSARSQPSTQATTRRTD